HHVISRTLKDTVCRYKTMQGYQVHRKAGWDTHGLPVEIEVEKKLGLSTKGEIEEYGIKEFNEQCRNSVFTYEKEWRELTERIAYWIDLDDPYITLDNDYIETVWWILNKFYEAGLIYRGHKILPYCPRCETPLASHEVSQGYMDETIDSIYVKFPLKGRDDEYFLVWTTTPWTLPSNVALAVNPELEYAKVQVDGEVYYLVRDRLDGIIGEEEDYQVLETLPGRELAGMEYEQLLPFVDISGKAFYVVTDGFVTAENGTGIVHIAPAFGEDDNRIGREYDLPLVQPVNQEGKFTKEVAPWSGLFVKEADPKITQHLLEHNKLFNKERMTHSYPHCWRCDTPLLYYAHDSWYIETTAFKEKTIANNKKINWYPQYVGEGRFGNWLENMIDWSISRDRYWGTPLNIWVCEDCGEKLSIASRQELADKATQDIDPAEVELHRPYVDEVTIKCSCGGEMKRTPEVIDCWFDSGSMPYAQWDYPFEKEDEFAKLFPADFICEGIDQTRGWFYSLLTISTFLFDEPAFKNVMVNDLILDKHGKKMSKSRGNTVSPWDVINQFGADATRWFLLAASPPWTPTKFNIDEVKEIYTKFFGTLKNVYSFFTMYANLDGLDPASFDVPLAERAELDRWMISSLNSLLKEVNHLMDNYDLTEAVRKIQSFIIDKVSNWYVRRSRERFWASELTSDKKAVYRTLYEVLVAITKVVAPVAPFIAEDIYGNLTHGRKESVHFTSFPRPDEEAIDGKLEESMNTVIEIVSLGRAARNSVQIKTRQPLQKILLPSGIRQVVDPMLNLIKEELNIKDIEFVEQVDKYVKYQIKPNFPVLGPKLGGQVKTLARELAAADASSLITQLREEGQIEVQLSGETFSLTEGDLDIRTDEREGFTVEISRKIFVVLDTELDEELIDEGLARELVSKVQTMRKELDYNISDQINLWVACEDRLQDAIEKYRDYVTSETLTAELTILNLDETSKADGFQEWDINGNSALLKTEQIK
ncbi:MAG: isoleucine--tRNA ligase, partial [Halanaerobium sp.]|nr:isoleucine--tRNA ligase [Halanaerobium sp.]